MFELKGHGITEENGKETPKKILEEYEARKEIREKIAEIGIQAYVKSLPDLQKAFEEDYEEQVGCIDEGMSGSVKNHLAGSGILLSEEEFEAFIEKTGIKTITSHDGCGAAKHYVIENDLDIDCVDEIYKAWAFSKAEKYGLKHCHISATEMIRPKEGHIAEVCYCDFSKKFTNWDQPVGLPSGFIVNIVDEEISSDDIELSIKIAFGDHGFRDLLTEKNPFRLVAIADDQKQLDKAIQELEKIDHNFGDRIKVDGFLVPERK